MRAGLASIALLGLLVAPFASAADKLSDPTRPMNFTAPSTTKRTAVVSAPSGPELQSVLISPTRRIAVISGQRVKVGDTISGGATVTDIKPYEVTLDRGGRETTLRLLPKLAKEQR